jgi:N-methyl-L-tryptophan oxidase
MSADDGGVTVRTRSGDKYHAAHVILSAGAWFRTLEPFIRLPIRSVRKVVGWFESKAESPLFDAGRFPRFTLGGSEGGYYGFPSIGGAGLKILDAYMPQSAGRLLRGAVCKYEFSPDDNFIIDRHPEHSNVLLAGGFSGHGFKFSSVVGEILSDLVVKGRTDQDLSLFAVSRFASEAEEASDPALK